MTHFQRIATLLLLSLFVLQIFAQSVSQQDDDKKKENVMTVTFDNQQKHVTVTITKTATPTHAPASNEKKVVHEQEVPEGHEVQHEEELGQKEPVHEQEHEPGHEGHIGQEYGTDIVHEEELHEEVPEESIPFGDYMGDEIDQIAEEAHPDMDPYVIEGEETPSASASAEDAAISAMAVNKTEPAAPTGPRPPVPQVTGCKTQGQIALTYSEGPSDVTAKIVRQLTKADARANFFVNATWLYTQQYAMVVQNIYNAGHFIGMTYRVANDDPSSMTDDAIRQDVINNAHIIETLINVSPKYVRLHYTEFKDIRTEGILRDLGFVVVGYNLDSQDYFKKDATGPGSINQIYSDTFKKYKDTYDAKGSFISIQYDLPYTGSLAAIPHVINTIEEEGYTMVRLDGCLNDATPYKKYANGTEYVGDKFSFSKPGYHQGQKAIVLESAAEAAIADEEFKIQGIEGLESSMANTQQVSLFAFLVVVGAFFILFL